MPTRTREALLASVREFVAAEVVPTAPALEHADAYPHQLVARMREAVERRLLDGARIAAKTKFFGKAEALHTGAEEAECIEQGRDGDVPRFRNIHGSDESDGVVEHVGGKAEEAVHFLLRGKKPQEKFGKLRFFARRGKNVVEEAIESFRKQAPVAGHAGFGEESGGVQVVGVVLDQFPHRVVVSFRGLLQVRLGVSWEA